MKMFKCMKNSEKSRWKNNHYKNGTRSEHFHGRIHQWFAEVDQCLKPNLNGSVLSNRPAEVNWSKIPAAIIFALTSGVIPVFSGLCSPNSMMAITNVKGAANNEQLAIISFNVRPFNAISKQGTSLTTNIMMIRSTISPKLLISIPREMSEHTHE